MAKVILVQISVRSFIISSTSTALIPAAAANTGFSAFSDVSLLHIQKQVHAPSLLWKRETCLGYSNGILTLAFGAIILLFINGNTERLIPLTHRSFVLCLSQQG